MDADSIFVPRPAIVGEIDRAVERSRESGLQVVWLFGETGQGKTRFMRDYLDERRDSLIVTYAACSAPLGTQSTALLKPYQPLKDIFEDLLRNYAETRRRLQLAKNISLTVLAMIPLVGDFFYGIKELRRDLTEYKRGERSVDFGHFARDCFQTLSALADDTAVVVALDDVQWSDKLTAAALREFSTTTGSSKPITIVLCGRRDELVQVPELAAMHDHLLDSPNAVEIEMPPFDSVQIDAYVRATFPATMPDRDMLLWLERKTGGNPFFLRSYLQHLVVEGVLTRDGRVTGDLFSYSGLPSEIRIVTNWLMKSLEEADLELLLTASVLGYEFTLHELSHLTQRGTLDLVRTLRRIKTAHGIVEPVGFRLANGKESTVYRFAQHAMHTALYNELTVEEKDELHRQTAHYLNELRAVNADQPDVMNSLAGALMLHARLGRQPEIEYESILLRARNTEEELDNEALLAQLRMLAPALGMMPDDLERMFREAMQLAPLMSRTMDAAHRASLLAAREETHAASPDALLLLVSTVFSHLAADRAAEAVHVMQGYIRRQVSHESYVHPLAHILYAVALLVHGIDIDRAIEALRTAAADSSLPDYAAFARVGLAVLTPSLGDEDVLRLLREAAQHEGRHARILRHAVAFLAEKRFGGRPDYAPFIEKLRDAQITEGGDLRKRYPRTTAAIAVR